MAIERRTVRVLHAMRVHDQERASLIFKACFSTHHIVPLRLIPFGEVGMATPWTRISTGNLYPTRIARCRTLRTDPHSALPRRRMLRSSSSSSSSLYARFPRLKSLAHFIFSPTYFGVKPRSQTGRCGLFRSSLNQATSVADRGVSTSS